MNDPFTNKYHLHLQELFDVAAQVYAEKPQKDIHGFVGTFTKSDTEVIEESLNIENTLWANTVVASGTVLGIVVYTGAESRSVMNTSQPKSKVCTFAALHMVEASVVFYGRSD